MNERGDKRYASKFEMIGGPSLINGTMIKGHCAVFGVGGLQFTITAPTTDMLKECLLKLAFSSIRLIDYYDDTSQEILICSAAHRKERADELQIRMDDKRA